MESMFAMETIGEDKVVDSPSLHQETVEPILYKLVRVDGDGRLVPATDDELMTVEELLEDEKYEFGHIIDAKQTIECNGTEVFCFGKTQFEKPQGQSAPEKHAADVVTSNIPHPLLPDLDSMNTQGNATAPPLNSEYITNDEFGSTDGCSNLDAGENNISTSTTGASLMPDFSKLNGEIFLEKLTVKDLQETFKATFGRETLVKDKPWLMRRISMGLSNSCDFSCTHFVIEGNGVVKKVEEENNGNVNGSISEDPIFALENTKFRGASSHEIPASTTTERDVPKALEGFNVSEDLNREERATKRVRKPTKRYIEEISEVDSRETSGKSMHSEKSCDYESAHPRNHVISIVNIPPDGDPIVMRKDSLGGSEMQIPYVSRIRRGRPRENFMTLKLQPNGTSEEEQVKKEPSPGDLQFDETDKDISTSDEKAKHFPERKTVEDVCSQTKHEHIDSYGDGHSDYNMMLNMATPAVGMRRKHHRPWTINEVTELVEGVSKFGVGRWSEIKRLSFANCPYRTPVDLKDKWRNLLKASFVQLPAENRLHNNSKKNASMLIPAPILLRVQELADMNGNISPSLNQSTYGGRNPDEENVGCL
ncbi:unnamed protein product [Cuscuta epithymum]|uniref:Uncharacterized protein n=1 Tax=Cuscuta epithymum TaxID=186058 RepID=A0AAV0F3S5_9ASTE|nr:unnamed protein product [Cuscuta epithymum]